MTSGQHIDYDALALEALRGVVRACLAQVSRTGLVGDHHFYIAFNTQAAGVGMSKRLKEKYPVEMTIVLQHRFWDLAVDDERFEVKLTFDGIPERLVVPFAAVKVFYDPSVPYVLQFEEVDMGARGDALRRGTRRTPSQTRQIAEQTVSGAAETAETPVDANAGQSADNHIDAGATTDRNDRRRPLRRNRPEREGVGQTPEDTRKTSEPQTAKSMDTIRPVAPPPAAEKAATSPAQPQPGSPKPAIVAVNKTADEPANPDEESASTDAAGAKIFDLSKFRGKK